MFTKYATLEGARVLDIKGSRQRVKTASFDKLADFEDYRTEDGYLYARIRAISSRVNKNHDGWPSVELAGGTDAFNKAAGIKTGHVVIGADSSAKYGYSTFLGKPIFVDHHNHDPSRARGVIVDAKLHVEDHKTAALSDPYYASAPDNHLPPTWVELLLEIDAKSFPRLAAAIIEGSKDPSQGIDGFSMGCDVEKSKCSHCGNEATTPDQYCEHVKLKGAEFPYKDPKTGRTSSRKAYEDCYGIKFFEISAVFDPADETALLREIRAHTAAENPELGRMHEEAFDPVSGEIACPECQGAGCPACRGTGQANPQAVMNPGRDGFNTPGLLGPSDMNVAPIENPQAQGFGPRRQGNFQKGSPDAGDDQYFGGKPGSSKKAYDSMIEQYGKEKGEEVYYRTRNKKKSESSFIQSSDFSQSSSSSSNDLRGKSISLSHPLHTQDDSCLLPLDNQKGLDLSQQHSTHPPMDLPMKNGLTSRSRVPITTTSVSSESRVNPVDQSLVGVSDLNARSQIHSVSRPPLMQGNASLSVNDPGKVTQLQGRNSHMDIVANKYVQERGGKWVIVQKGTGKTLSTHDSKEKAEAAFRAMEMNKHGSPHTAEAPPPQVDELKVPEGVDTLREETICPVCGSDMDSETCDVCGYERPPEGFDNPDLTKAKEGEEPVQEMNPEQAQNEPQNEPPDETFGPATFGEGTSNTPTTAHVTNDMSWTVSTTHEAHTNPSNETAVVPNAGPATDEPKDAVVKIDHTQPVTSHVRTAEDFLAAADGTRRTMSQKTADAASGAPEAATPDKNIDVDAVGGIMEATNEDASKVDAQIDVDGEGYTGPHDVAADKTETVDQGDEHSKNVEEIHTKTWGNGSGVEKQRDPVGGPAYPAEGGVTSSWQVTALDSEPFPSEDGGLAGGGATEGTQPADPVGVPDERVDVLDSTTSPENNSGPTKTWSGTDGNKIYRQQDPVTNETLEKDDIVNLSPSTSSTHIFAAMKLADREVELGLTSPSEKYERAAELEKLSPEELQAEARVVSRVKTAGLSKATKTAMRMPAMGRNASVEKESKEEKAHVPDAAIFL